MPTPNMIGKAKIAARVASVAMHCRWEAWFPRQVLRADEVPVSYAHITPEWLTAVLCANIPGGQVLACTPTGGSVGTSTRQGLALELNQAARAAGIPERVFTKGTDRFTQRLLLGLAGVIGGEIDFYLRIRPHLEIEAPHGYFACLDPASWRSMIIMEDISHSKQARFISTETLITRALIEDHLGNLAKWHGALWSHARFNEDLRHLRTPAAFLRNLDGFLSVPKRAARGLEQAEGRVPDRLRGQTHAAYRAMWRSFELNAQAVPTLLHGDPHIGQTYITAKDHVGIGDWSGILRGEWAYDYAYALVSALTVENRRAWEKELLRFYLDRLHQAGGPTLDYDAAWLSYRRHLFYPYICWLMTLAGGSSVTPEMQPRNVGLDIVERTAHAIDDLDALTALT